MKRLLQCAAFAAAFLWSAVSLAFAQGWTHVRGDASGSGLIDVVTAPAQQPVKIVPRLGHVYPGVAPVIGANGTVYIATVDKGLRAFSADGALLWERKTSRSLIASPVISKDGSIFVAGTNFVADHRPGKVPGRLPQSTLYKFRPDGTRLFAFDFPPAPSLSQGTGSAAGAPVIWRFDAKDVEMIVVPVYYSGPGTTPSVSLVAFNIYGALRFNQPVTKLPVPTLTSEGGGLCDYICIDNWYGLNRPPVRPDSKPIVLPHVAFYAPAGAAPFLVASDTFGNIVGYKLDSGAGFSEQFRTKLLSGGAANFQNPLFMAAPTVLGGGTSAVLIKTETQSFLMFAGPGPVTQDRIQIPLSVSGATVTADGRIAVVNLDGGATLIQAYPNVAVSAQAAILGKSAAPAAASRTHVFVNADNLFSTLDARTFSVVGAYQWTNGGLWPPSIGGNGRVYAVANSSLYIFPAPPCRGPNCGTTNVPTKRPPAVTTKPGVN